MKPVDINTYFGERVEKPKKMPRQRVGATEQTIIEFIRSRLAAADVTPEGHTNIKGLQSSFCNVIRDLGLSASLAARERTGRLILFRKEALENSDDTERDPYDQQSLFDC